MSQELLDALAAVKQAVTERMDGMDAAFKKVESRVTDAELVVRSAPVDHKRTILEALIAPLTGKSVEEIVRGMGDTFLRVEAVKQVLPPLDMGVDLMTIFLMQPSSAITANLATVADDPLGTGAAGEAADWAGTGVPVGLFPHHHYKGFSQHEAIAANIDVAAEIGKQFFRRRNKSLKKAFVDGNGTVTLKGMQAYTVTYTWAEAGKLFCELIGGSGTCTIAQFRAAVQSAKNRLPEDSTPVVMMRGDMVALAENDTVNNVNYWKEVAKDEAYYCGCLVVRNDYLPAASASATKIVAAVLAKGRGYGVAHNPQLVVAADAKADKKNLYTGQSFGGAIADLSAIVGIQVKHN